MAQAIIAGEFPVALAGGNIVNANLCRRRHRHHRRRGQRTVFLSLCSSIDQTARRLKGKALGITRYGASTDVSLRALSKKIWLGARSRRQNFPNGRPAGNSSRACRPESFKAAFCSSPADFRSQKTGFSCSPTSPKKGLDYPTTSLVSTRSTIKKDRETVKRFLMAYSEAVDRLFRDKELAIKIIGKWTRTQDRETLESSYEYATNFIERPPRLPFKATRNICRIHGRNRSQSERPQGRRVLWTLDLQRAGKDPVSSNRWDGKIIEIEDTQCCRGST